VRKLLRGMIIYFFVLVVPLVCTASICTAQVPKMIALTFDDGPTPEYTERILDILKQKGIKATFFVTGKNASAYPDVVRKIVADGHVIGNHSYSHANFQRLTDEQVFNEILGTQQVIYQITGHSPKFVRYPLGFETPAAQKATRELGLTGSVGWHWGQDVHDDDWMCKGVDPTLRFTKSATQDGAILLVHDANEVTRCPDQLAWLGQYIDWARQHGFIFGLLRTAEAPNKINMNTWVNVVPDSQAQRWNE
jgi:peptidoglycan/xylan/chitin deacetylase (PgdA/CDA1 family)